MNVFETVLVVDSDPAVLRDVSFYLSPRGYNVLTAGSGMEAIRKYEQSRFPVHLVLTAVMMPGMSGFDLAHSLTQWNRKAVLIYMSECNREMLFAENARGASLFLRKPFSEEALLEKVREALNVTRRPVMSIASSVQSLRAEPR